MINTVYRRFFIILVVLAGSLVLGCERDEPGEEIPVVRPVKMLEISNQSIGRRLEFPGRVSPTVQSEHSFEVPGRIASFPVLWSKAIILASGDEGKARYEHIKLRAEQMSQEGSTDNKGDLGFGWWTIWAWLGLIVGNLYVAVELTDLPELMVGILILNTVLMIGILRYNKWFFLVATVISFNPILWIINGFYLKNRWHHPKTNKMKLD